VSNLACRRQIRLKATAFDLAVRLDFAVSLASNLAYITRKR